MLAFTGSYVPVDYRKLYHKRPGFGEPEEIEKLAICNRVISRQER
jgi:hypothetical protein